MRTRTVLYADDGMVLTDGTNYGTVIWLAEGVSADTYHTITQAEWEAILAQKEQLAFDGGAQWS